MEKSINKKSVALLILFIITLLVNFITATGSLNGMTQKMISDKYMTLITPGSLAFSIWSLIYLLTMYIIIKSLRGKDKLDNLFPYIVLIFITNIIWNILFVTDYIGLSSIAILVYLLILLKINNIIKDYKYTDIVKITFGIHGGWLLVATLVNFAVYFKSISISYMNRQSLFALLSLILLSALALYIGIYLKNPVFLLPVSWACLNISIAHSKGTFNYQFKEIQIASLIGSVVLLIGVFYIFKYRKLGYNQ